jgi:hypothetical protein
MATSAIVVGDIIIRDRRPLREDAARWYDAARGLAKVILVNPYTNGMTVQYQTTMPPLPPLAGWGTERVAQGIFVASTGVWSLYDPLVEEIDEPAWAGGEIP